MPEAAFCGGTSREETPREAPAHVFSPGWPHFPVSAALLRRDKVVSTPQGGTPLRTQGSPAHPGDQCSLRKTQSITRPAQQAATRAAGQPPTPTPPGVPVAVGGGRRLHGQQGVEAPGGRPSGHGPAGAQWDPAVTTLEACLELSGAEETGVGNTEVPPACSCGSHLGRGSTAVVSTVTLSDKEPFTEKAKRRTPRHRRHSPLGTGRERGLLGSLAGPVESWLGVASPRTGSEAGSRSAGPKKITPANWKPPWVLGPCAAAKGRKCCHGDRVRNGGGGGGGQRQVQGPPPSQACSLLGAIGCGHTGPRSFGAGIRSCGLATAPSLPGMHRGKVYKQHRPGAIRQGTARSPRQVA